MALQNFLARSLPAISAAWLNMIDRLVTQSLGITSGIDSGVAGAAVVTLNGTVTEFVRTTGTQVSFVPAAANLGASTLNVNGSGVAAIVNQAGNALTGGELSKPLTVMWTGTQWKIIAGSIPIANARTALEISAAVVPVNYDHPPGYVLRYGNNTVPGTTDMTTAFQNAGLSSLAPYALADLCLITGSIPLIDNQHWWLAGTRITITGNTKVFTVAVGIDDWSITGDWSVTGDNDNSGSLSGSGAAVEVTDSKRWRIGGCTAKNIKGFGIRILPGLSVSPRAEHGQIDLPQCMACTTGLAFETGTQPGAEYITVIGPMITRCGIGMYVQAGNIAVSGGTIIDNTMNVRLITGDNGNHGTFTGTHINHPTGTYNVHATNVTNGHTFTGCHLYEGTIWLEGCKGVVFEGGIVAPSNILNDSDASPVSGYNFFSNNWWAPGYSTQINSNNGATNELIVIGGNGPAVYNFSTGISVSDPSSVYASVRRAPANTQALTSGVAATLVCNAESVDRRNAYNSTTGVFTVPTEQGGQYRISANLMFSGTAMNVLSSIVTLNINGAATAIFLPEINSTTSLSVIVVSDQYLAAADQVTLVGTITGTNPLFGHATYESRVQFERIDS